MSAFILGERYHHGNGLLYRTDARIKILIAVAFAFGVTTIPHGHWLALAGFELFALTAIAISQLPPRLVFGRALLALPFVAAALPLIFTRAGSTVFTVPLLGWTASSEGLTAVASIMLRSWFAVLVAIVLTSCTTPIDLMRGLERLKTPRILASTIFFMYRYLFVIGGEGQRLMRARESRSAIASGELKAGGSVGWRGKVLGTMIGSLFIRSYERSERIYSAMQARGYDGSIRFVDERTLKMRDWLLFAVALTTIGLLVLYARV